MSSTLLFSERKSSLVLTVQNVWHLCFHHICYVFSKMSVMRAKLFSTSLNHRPNPPGEKCWVFVGAVQDAVPANFGACEGRMSSPDLLKLQQGVVQAANVVVHYGLGAELVVEVGEGHLRHGAATQRQQTGVFLAHAFSFVQSVHSTTLDLTPHKGRKGIGNWIRPDTKLSQGGLMSGIKSIRILYQVA